MSMDELFAHVLRLSREERARLAEELLFSLEESEEQVAAAWVDELERRSRDIAEGKTKTVEASVACSEILAELELRVLARASALEE